jgi:hypothetical protein
MSEDFLGLGTGSNVGAGQDQAGLVFDLTDVKEDTGFEVLPKGTYPVIVDELEFGESSKGDPMFTAKFKVTEGEHEGRVLFDYWVLGGNGAEFGLAKLKKFLTRVCPDANLAAFNAQAFADEAVAVNRECSVVVGVQKQKTGEYKGELRNQIRDILAASTGSFL